MGSINAKEDAVVMSNVQCPTSNVQGAYRRLETAPYLGKYCTPSNKPCRINTSFRKRFLELPRSIQLSRDWLLHVAREPAQTRRLDVRGPLLDAQS
jgi:hypothetical protein